MKPAFTISKLKSGITLPGLITVLSVALFSLQAISSAAAYQNSSKENLSEDKQGNNDKTFSFFADKDGKNELWKVVFKDDKIVHLYRGDEEIPEDQIEKYEDFVGENINDLADEIRPHGMRHFNFEFDGKDFEKNMKFFKGQMKHLGNDSEFCGLKEEQFNKMMKRLGDKLKHLRVKIDFDTSEFKHGMADLGNVFKHFKPEGEYFDWNGFNRNMKEFSEEMEKKSFAMKDFKIDLSGLGESMKELKESMTDFKSKMKDFKNEMKKFEGFMKDVRKELLSDGYIKSDDEEFSLTMSSDKMTVNGKQIPDNQFKKYKEIYKKYFGKDIENEIKINTN